MALRRVFLQGPPSGGFTRPSGSGNNSRIFEPRALLKLGQHPELLALWRQYLASELTEHARRFSVREIQALLAVVRRRAELEVVLRFLQIIPH